MGYVDGNTPLTEPLNTFSVARCIGSGNGDVATLCQSKSLINPRSAKKPVRYLGTGDVDNHPRELTDLEFAETNYGIVIETSYESLEDAILKVRNALNKELTDDKGVKAFYYDCPVEGDMCRLTDFVGYVNNAGNWVEIDFENHGSASLDNPQNTKIRIRFQQALTSFQSLQSWGTFQELWSDNVPTGRFGLAIVDTNYNVQYFIPLLSGENLQQQQEDLLEFTPNIAGSYLVYPMLVNANLSSTTYPDGVAIEGNTLKELEGTGIKFYPLPYGAFQSWNPVSSGTPEGGNPPTANTVTLSLNDSVLTTVDSANMVYRLDSFNLGITRTSTDANTIYVVVYVGTAKSRVLYIDTWNLDFAEGETELAIEYTLDADKVEGNSMNFQVEDDVVMYVDYKLGSGATASTAMFNL